MGFALLGRETAAKLVRQIDYSSVTDEPGCNEYAFAIRFNAAAFTCRRAVG